MDVDYYEGKAYSPELALEIRALWDAMYDVYYKMKQNYSSAKAMDACTSATLLLTKIELLRSNLDSFVRLYENYNLIHPDTFVELKQEMLRNFTLIEKRIVPQYFGSLEDNFNIVSEFINSLDMTYAIENPKAEQMVEDEVANVYKRAARVGKVLAGMYFDLDKMSVMAWEGYEEAAVEEIENQKSDN